MSEKRTNEVGKELNNAGYWCINSDIENIYEMLKNNLAVRFAEEGNVIPNFETRFSSDEFEKTALEESLKVELNLKEIQISPLELQIAYKLYLGSEKDLEDGLHLYRLFEKNIKEEKLENYAKKLEVGDELNELREA
ncbi:hypothetical protein C9439_05755 [archaeon SCG-AAA382B04]|nr:hypothetical protein C9439_05755 [archaeon SCG-AAA382B04]